jgi:two-component system response regulator TtrR
MEKTIFVVDDDLDVCEGLRSLFEMQNLSVEMYSNGREFLAKDHSGQQGCLILDVCMPSFSGIDLLLELKNKNNHLSTIVMSSHNDIPIVVKAMQAGAIDFILKPLDVDYLLEITHAHLAGSVNKNPFNGSLHSNPLTNREQEVMNLILDGKYNKRIAYELDISISTVEAHRARIMTKLNAKNLAQLIKNYFHIPDSCYK